MDVKQFLYRNGTVALGYFLLAVVSVLITSATQIASALWLPAGFAAVVIYAYGVRVVPGVFIGTALGNLVQVLRVASSRDWPHELVGMAGISTGAVAGGLVAGYCIWRILNVDPTLARWRSALGLLLLAGPLASILSAVIGSLTLFASGQIPKGDVGASMFTWWAGDSLGVLLGAPVFLVVLGSPRSYWRSRAGAIVIPLVAVIVFISAMYSVITRSEAARIEQRFARISQEASDDVAMTYGRYEALLVAAERYAALVHEPTARQFIAFLRGPIGRAEGVQAIGWAPVVTSAERTAFEREHARDMPIGIYEHSPGGEDVTARRRATYVPLTYVEPTQQNAAAVGFDYFSESVRRRALRRAADEGAAIATDPIQLVQGPRGVLVVTPIYRGAVTPNSVPERRRNLTGYIIGSFALPELIDSAKIDESQMTLIVRDLDAPSSNRLLHVVGAAAASSLRSRAADISSASINANAPFTKLSELTIGGHRWQFEFVPSAGYVARELSQMRYFVMLSGLFIALSVSSLVLFLAGYTAAIELEVARRTDELQRSERRTSRIIETAQEAFVSIDATGAVLEWNSQAEETFGWLRDEVVGRSLGNLIVPEQLRDAHEQALARYVPGAPSHITGHRVEMPALHRDGHEFRVEMTITPVVDDGKLELHAFLHDITDRLIAERERAHAAELKTHFVAMASHEMRTPLTSIIGYGQTLRERWGDLDEATKLQFVDIIVDQGQRFGGLISDLLTITQIEDGKLRVYDEVTPVRDAIGEAAADADIDVEVDAASDLLVHMGRQHLVQVLINFLRNADKYGRPPYRVTTELVDAAVRISVRDEGDGVPATFVPHLFERFSQADYRASARTRGDGAGKARGVGLGLSIVEALVSAYGGRVWYEPNEPRGARFIVEVPRADR